MPCWSGGKCRRRLLEQHLVRLQVTMHSWSCPRWPAAQQACGHVSSPIQAQSPAVAVGTHGLIAGMSALKQVFSHARSGSMGRVSDHKISAGCRMPQLARHDLAAPRGTHDRATVKRVVDPSTLERREFRVCPLRISVLCHDLHSVMAPSDPVGPVRKQSQGGRQASNALHLRARAALSHRHWIARRQNRH